MDSPGMLACTPSAYWPLILAYVLPPVGALLSATALLVAARARTTSEAVLSTLAVVVPSSQPPSGQPERRGSRAAAQDPKKH